MAKLVKYEFGDNVLTQKAVYLLYSPKLYLNQNVIREMVEGREDPILPDEVWINDIRYKVVWTVTDGNVYAKVIGIDEDKAKAGSAKEVLQSIYNEAYIKVHEFAKLFKICYIAYS